MDSLVHREETIRRGPLGEEQFLSGPESEETHEADRVKIAEVYANWCQQGAETQERLLFALLVQGVLAPYPWEHPPVLQVGDYVGSVA